MTSITAKLAAFTIAAGITTAVVGLDVSIASAQPAPPPGPAQADEPPAWAPPKPAAVWDGQPVVWTSGWGGRWGIWINGGFIPLTSNPVSNSS